MNKFIFSLRSKIKDWFYGPLWLPKEHRSRQTWTQIHNYDPVVEYLKGQIYLLMSAALLLSSCFLPVLIGMAGLALILSTVCFVLGIAAYVKHLSKKEHTTNFQSWWEQAEKPLGSAALLLRHDPKLTESQKHAVQKLEELALEIVRMQHLSNFCTSRIAKLELASGEARNQFGDTLVLFENLGLLPDHLIGKGWTPYFDAAIRSYQEQPDGVKLKLKWFPPFQDYTVSSGHHSVTASWTAENKPDPRDAVIGRFVRLHGSHHGIHLQEV